ncbi:HipA domain-containing protein [Piscinibacter sakaiensis]|uniref:HIPA protein n=1 Tax=Piscinibacter sakaiensis TaxID=1547922 RepID=A0A0K8P264_PISS1|nr:HipA domain-containing protein [Piscinibacter sakaiensis]GAP36762.1 HIPA protein [Piscinibacter sakaiensis]
MGALAFRPSADFEPTRQDLTLLELARASRDVVEDHDVSALETLVMVGGSPHGARPKVLVQYDVSSGRISSREDATGEPWLVKFNAANEHQEVCAIEQVYAGMARASGIDMPESRQFDLGRNLAAFGVKRFDRERGLRVPVQSIAGALHANFREPSIDYVTVLRLARLFTRDEREVLKAYRQAVFNVVFNNQDDHAKNIAFRMDEHMQWRLSPAYDLTFARGPRGQHQTSVAGAGVPTRADLLRLADDGGVDRKAAEAVIERICAQASTLTRALGDATVRAATAQDIARAVDLNVKRCAVLPAVSSKLLRQASSPARKTSNALGKRNRT